MIHVIEHFDQVAGNMQAPVASVPEAKGLGIGEHSSWRNRHPVPSFMERDLANSGLSIYDVNISEFISSTEGYEILYMNRCTNEPYRCKDGNIFSRTKLQYPIGKMKYRSKKDAGIKPYVLSAVHKHLSEDDPEWVFVTEGEKKAITATKCGFPIIGIGGIWMWMQEKGDKSLNDELIPYLSNRKVVMIYDSDSHDTEQKRKNFDVCISDFATALKDHGSTLYRVDLPKVGDGKTGLDDLFVAYAEHAENPEDQIGSAMMDVSRYIGENIRIVKPLVRFWSFSDKKGYVILPDKLMEFLDSQGFGAVFLNSTDNSAYMFIRAEGGIISESSDLDIRRFVSEWIDQYKPELKNAFAKTLHRCTNKNIFETMLQEFPRTVHRDKRDKVFLYFRNGVLEITKDSHTLTPYSVIDSSFIWAREVLRRDFVEDKVLGEFEKFFTNINNGDADRCGRMMTGFGYLIHRFKDKANAKAVIFNDESIDDQQGGSGKGILVQAVEVLRNVQRLDFRTRKQNGFVLQGVDPFKDVLHLEDVDKNFDFAGIFNMITSNLEIENKGKDRFSIPFEESPKFVISTNFAVKGAGESVNRRKVEYELFKHYSRKFTPMDEFGHLLFDDWTEDEWHRFDTWAVKAIQRYLQNGLMEGENTVTEKKRLIEETCSDFVEYMQGWEKTMEINHPYVKSKFYVDFIGETMLEVKFASNIKVRRWIERWAEYKKIAYREEQKKIDGENKRCFWFE